MSQVKQLTYELQADFFYSFAELYKYPTKEFYEEITTGKLDELLKIELMLIDEQLKPNFQEKVPSLNDLQASYMNCFSGFTQPFAPAVESIYKIWTNDTTAKVSIANSKGYLMGDSALHMKYLLKQYELVLPEGYENSPDHLTILLEFCAYLQAHTTREHVTKFISDHLDWLDSFENELIKLRSGSFYVYTTRLLRKTLSNYQTKIERS